MSVSSSTPVFLGQILAERYRLQRLLGEGAVGSVFAADDLDGARTVALKVLKTAVFGDRYALERFRREIDATMRIECEYIVRTYGVDYLGNGTPFMVMEYVDARDVSKTISECGPLPVERAIEFTLQICLALAHAHRIGIVHRDIKPANLLLVRQPNGRELVKVLDFGISKIAHGGCIAVPPKLTGNAVRLGSPMYMSPEQRTLGREVDERTDIWSLGITLFEMIAGVVPFDSSPQSIREEREAQSSVPSLACYRPGIPRGLDSVISRCLQRMPELRFQNVAELARALAPYAMPEAARLCREVVGALGTPRAHRGASNADRIDPGTTLGPSIAPGPPTVRWQERSQRRPLVWIALASALGTLLSAVVALYLYLPKRGTGASARAFSAMPITTAWSLRARAWDERLSKHPESVTFADPQQVPNAPSRLITVLPIDAHAATSPAAQGPHKPAVSASKEPVSTATGQGAAPVDDPNQPPDLGY